MKNLFQINRTASFFFFFFFVLAILSLGSCTQESALIADIDEPTKSYEGVDEGLWIYFQRFEEAAADRGDYIDLAALNITGSIEPIEYEGVVGLCSHNPNQPKHVRIDADFFNRATVTKKEMIVFHELGHCILKRGHNDEANDNGVCQSIMRSGMGTCLDSYNNNTRNNYLDELFNNQ